MNSGVVNSSGGWEDKRCSAEVSVPSKASFPPGGLHTSLWETFTLLRRRGEVLSRSGASRPKRPSRLVVSTRPYGKPLPCSEEEEKCSAEVERPVQSVLPAWWSPHVPVGSLYPVQKKREISALSGVYVSCLSLSLLGSCSVIVVSILRRSHLSVQAAPLLQLALADFLASAVLMGTVVTNFLSYDTLSVKTSEKLCNYGLPLSLTFYFISFLLVIIYACESAYVFKGWRERAEAEGFENQSLRRRKMFCLFYITVWLVPIIGYIVYVKTVTVMQATLTPANKVITYVSSAPDTARFCDSCILFLHITNDTCPTVDPGHAEFIQVFTLTSVMTVLVCCTVVYWKLQSWYRNYKSTTMFRMSQNHPGGIWSSARYMILVIVFCWAPGLLLVSLSFASSPIGQNLFPLYIIQAISVSLQGFLNSIVYAWRRRNFRDAVLGERMPLMAYSQKAFFDQSLNDPLGH